VRAEVPCSYRPVRPAKLQGGKTPAPGYSKPWDAGSDKRNCGSDVKPVGVYGTGYDNDALATAYAASTAAATAAAGIATGIATSTASSSSSSSSSAASQTPVAAYSAGSFTSGWSDASWSVQSSWWESGVSGGSVQCRTLSQGGAAGFLGPAGSFVGKSTLKMWVKGTTKLSVQLASDLVRVHAAPVAILCRC
jgi:hypothetical protein